MIITMVVIIVEVIVAVAVAVTGKTLFQEPLYDLQYFATITNLIYFHFLFAVRLI